MPHSVAQRRPELASNTGATRYILYGPSFSNSAEARRGRMRESAKASLLGPKPLKRAIDVFGAIVGIFFFGPLMLVIAALVKWHGGDAIFSHERIGRSGKPFRCLKFRTMVPDADAKLVALLEADPKARLEWVRDQKLRHDPRITRLGAFLRKTSLDELPQFFNVLKGDMSLVGPRPITAEEIKRYGDRFSLYAKCRPGITGIWQVSGRNDTSYPTRVALDAYYTVNQSILFDAVILLRTFGVITSRNGAR